MLRGSLEHIAYLQLHQLREGLCMAFLAGIREEALLQWTTQPTVPDLIVLDSDADLDEEVSKDSASPAGPLRPPDGDATGDMAAEMLVPGDEIHLTCKADPEGVAAHKSTAAGANTPASIAELSGEQEPAHLQPSEQGQLHNPAAERALAPYKVTSLGSGLDLRLDCRHREDLYAEVFRCSHWLEMALMLWSQCNEVVFLSMQQHFCIAWFRKSCANEAC